MAEFDSAVDTVGMGLLDDGVEAILKALEAHLPDAAQALDIATDDAAALSCRLSVLSDRSRLMGSLQTSKLTTDAMIVALVRQATLRQLILKRIAELGNADEFGSAENALEETSAVASKGPIVHQFVMHLVHAGLTARAVLNISKADVRALVEIITKRERGVSLPALVSSPLAVLIAQPDDNEPFSVGTSTRPTLSSTASTKPSHVTLSPSVSLPPVRTIDDWFALPDDPAFGILWKQRHWEPEDIVWLTEHPEYVPMPLYDTAELVAAADPLFAALSIDWSDRASIETKIASYIRSLVIPPELIYPVNWLRVWVYILFARHDRERFAAVFQEDPVAYFERLMLARPHHGRLSRNARYPQFEIRMSSD